jgi:DMSO/TMAO reductase YedYZ molybdopterin-dependent catalytic subunit
MKSRMLAVALLLVPLAWWAHAEGRVKLDSTTPYGTLINMDPGNVDPSALPLTSVESLHSTGSTQNVDLASWRLTVSGPRVRSALSLSYEDLGRMPSVKKRAILICPGFFYDYLEWEGVPLSALLQEAGVQEYQRVGFTSVDGYSVSFKKEEAQSHLLLVATKNNGVPLPRAHGFPARLVAEDVLGGQWVKYLTKITLE